MKERFYRTLNIKLSESSQVFDLLTVQFFIGLANALVSIIAFTLFVYSYPIHTLAEIYLVIAVLLMLLNFIYEKLEHRFTSLQLLKYIIGFSAILLMLLWIGLSYIDKQQFIFALLVSSVLIYMLTGYAFWGLVSLLFNVRESRRVFSIVGSGDIPAKLIGYLAAPLLIPLVGINNLIWLAVISLVIGLLLFTKYIRKKSWDAIKKRSHTEDHHADDVFTKKDFVSFFFKNKLIFAISLLSLLSYNVFVLVDFTFISQVKLRFENITDLAVYIAIFFAIGRAIALAFKLIFTSRVIERLGVIYCLFITPAALFLFCLLFFFFGGKSDYNLYIFGIMAMLAEVIRSTIQEPVFFILFQPLKESLRLKGHIISKGYMYPPSLIIVGLTLLFLYRAGIEISIILAIKVVIINLIIWAGIIFLIRRYYLNTVHASIKKGTFNSEDIYITDQYTIDILLKKIASGEKIEVIYSLNLLEKSGYPGIRELLGKLVLEGKDVAVRKYALDRLAALEKVNIPTLKKLVDEETETELRQKAVSLLCSYDPMFLKKASENIGGLEYPIRKVIIINLLNQREFNFLFKAGNEINNLLSSSKTAERELAVEIISELKNIQFSEPLSSLIHDREISVRRLTISTACKLRMKKMLPSITALLENPEDKNIVLKGLQIYGDQFFEDFNDISADTKQKYMADFIKIATKVNGIFSTTFLLSKLEIVIPVLKDKIINALWLKDYEPSNEKEKEHFTVLLNQYLKMAMEKISDYHQIPDFDDKELIKRSIYNEVKNDLAISLKLCALLFRKKEISRILELMEIEKRDKLYNAMEMIELLLPNRVSKDLNFIFDFILDPVHNKSAGTRQEIGIFFSKAIFNSPFLYNHWTKAICVYASRKNNDTAFLKQLREQVQPDEHFIVRETKNYIMNFQK